MSANSIIWDDCSVVNSRRMPPISGICVQLLFDERYSDLRSYRGFGLTHIYPTKEEAAIRPSLYLCPKQVSANYSQLGDEDRDALTDGRPVSKACLHPKTGAYRDRA